MYVNNNLYKIGSLYLTIISSPSSRANDIFAITVDSDHGNAIHVIMHLGEQSMNG